MGRQNRQAANAAHEPLTRDQIKADILDRLLTGWSRMDPVAGTTAAMLSLNADTMLDEREAKVVRDVLNGTEPEKKRWRR